MSLIMEDFKPSVSTLEEVKKLQDLVRKLEIQNKHLRNKQNDGRQRSVSPVKEVKSSLQFPSRSMKKNSNEKGSVDTGYKTVNTERSVRDEYFDDLEIIRVSDIEMSDDESWLYSPPKSLTLEQKNESPYKWLRKDVDDPENQQLQFTKKALLTKLNALEILSPPSKMTSHHPEKPPVGGIRRSQVFCKTSYSAQNRDPSHVDTRTFTRSKKKEAIDFLEKLDLMCRERVEPVFKFEPAFKFEQLNRRGSDVSSDSVSSCHVLEDANDVQEVARMQEESLRMSSPLGTPKRGPMNSMSNRKISTSSRGSVSDQDLSENSVFGSQIAEDSICNEAENNSYKVESSHHSDQSSPSESPYGSNVSLHNAGKVKIGGYRRSLPNLNRDPLVLRQSKDKVFSESKVQSRNQIKSSTVVRKSDTSLEIAQKSRKEVMSHSRLKQPTNHMPSNHSNFESSHNSEPTTIVPRSADSSELKLHSRSGLPRPSRASSATRTPARSGIPMPSMLNKRRVEDSWSEGCF